MGRFWVGIVALGIWALPLRADNSLSIALAWPRSQHATADGSALDNEDQPRTLSYPNGILPVLLKNESTHPLRLCNSDGSGGYANLSFRIKLDDGRSIPIEKKPIWNWERNPLYFWLLQPGETFVLEAALYDGSWAWDEPPLRPHHGLIIPIYKATPSDHLEEMGVWSGVVEGQGVPIQFQ